MQRFPFWKRLFLGVGNFKQKNEFKKGNVTNFISPYN